MTHLPLAEKIRPQTLDAIIGQQHLVGPKGFLTKLIANGKPLSIILWGPPGCGKTSIARLYANAFKLSFYSLSGVWDGIAELKKIIKETKDNPLFHRGVMIFVDEIHRFNKAQQDAFLPFIEDGTITLVGATVENPSFHLNNALLSRLRVLTLNPLSSSELKLLLNSGLNQRQIILDDTVKQHLVDLAQGDGRYLINLIEQIEGTDSQSLSIDELHTLLQKRSAHFDRAGENHYNLISALHKSVRGSDPDAALYWFARMLEGGEDPLFIARRVIRIASEDIGLADPHALSLATAAREAFAKLGSPEGELAIAEAIVYLALAPKSNAIYLAYGRAREQAKQSSHLPPPKTILNAPTKLMKELDYGKDYFYDHETPQAFSGQNYFPEELPRPNYYTPTERGFEREMGKRLDYFTRLRESRHR